MVLVLVAAGAGYGGYQLGLRATRPGTLVAASISPSANIRTTPSPVPTTTPAQSGFSPATPVHNAVTDGLNCKLPVYLPGQRGSGGFLSFPNGTITPDQSSNSGAPGSSMGGSDPGDWFGSTYDNAVKRWLPVPYTWVSPDGALYAYAMDYNRHAGVNNLIEVNAQTGSSAVLQGTSPVNGAWQVIAVSPAYVYAINPQKQGLYSVPISGPWNNENYISDGFWTAASGFYAYGSATPDGGAIVRIDVRNPTQRVPWFDKSSSAQILGFDAAGNPVIWAGTDLWIASAPDQAMHISAKPPLAIPTSQQGSTIYGAQAPVPDSHGLWFSTTDGIYLYVGGQTTKVSNLVAQVAGSCS